MARRLARFCDLLCTPKLTLVSVADLVNVTCITHVFNLKPVTSNYEPPRPRALGPLFCIRFAEGATLSSLKLSVKTDVLELLNFEGLFIV